MSTKLQLFLMKALKFYLAVFVNHELYVRTLKNIYKENYMV